jgi:hypothetical protein
MVYRFGDLEGALVTLVGPARKVCGMNRNAWIAVVVVVVIALFATGVLGGGGGGGY